MGALDHIFRRRDARELTFAQQVQNIIRRQSLAFNGVWYDPSDLSTLFQDAAGTIPVTGAGQPVGRILDKSGRGNHATQATAGYKPLYQVDNGRGYLAFDGVDDFLVTGNVDFSASDKIAVTAGVRKLSDASIGIALEFSASVVNNNGSFYLTVPMGTGLPGHQFAAKGTVAAVYNLTAGVAPDTRIVSYLAGIGGAYIKAYSNGVFGGGGAANLGTGNFGNYPLYIGRRAGTSLPFNGSLYGLCVIGGLDGIYKLKKIEQYLAKKTGVII